MVPRGPVWSCLVALDKIPVLTTETDDGQNQTSPANNANVKDATSTGVPMTVSSRQNSEAEDTKLTNQKARG